MKMKKFLQNKLWRDKIVEKVEQSGSILHKHILDDEEYDKQLRLKLREESDELRTAQTRLELMKEIADIFEVIDALCALHNFSLDELKELQTKKQRECGGFQGRQFVTIAEHPEGSYSEQYCRAQPEKYPEIIAKNAATTNN